MNAVQQLSPKEVENITVSCIKRMKKFLAEEERKTKEAEERNEIYVPGEAPFFFAIRIRSALRAPPKVIKDLKSLRLHRIHTGTFVVNNKSTKPMLHNVKSYIAYGTLSLQTIRRMLYERAFCKYNGERKNITPEVLFDRFGGEINTIEEIVEALFLGRTNASAINKWLWPFRLSSPRKGYGGRKIRDFVDGGSTGDHGKYLDELVSRML